jgi:2-polyprenyl-6-methoxyphenol hydroxylase-like FAD-dependent oxidoreductase
MTPAATFDVVIVGGGIAGGALGSVLARAGKSVLIIERTTEYTDKVRGEFMVPWGVADAIANGVYDALMAAGGNLITRYVPYDEVTTPAEAEASVATIDALVPGVGGGIALGHPDACRTLDALARNDGATVVHGAEVLEVVAGASPSVAYRFDGQVHTVSCRLVVGADGRESFVRKALGLELHRTTPRVYLGGLLIENVRDWPETDFAIGTEGDRILLVFPQIENRARLYLGFKVEDKQRLAGADKAAAFLKDFDCSMIPDSDRLAKATPAGPCAAFPMTDSWTDTPVVDGAVLIGDAAGWSDPMIGQGLSVAMRDARQVAAAVQATDDWSARSFDEYATERAERMRRLRACVAASTDARMPLGEGMIEERRRRVALIRGADPDLFMLNATAIIGPEMIPAASFEPEVRERLLAAT